MTRAVILLLALALAAAAQTPPHVSRAKEIVYTAPANFETDPGLRAHIERYQTDHAALNRYYTIDEAPQRIKALRTFHASWLDALKALNFAKLSHDAQVDHILLNNRIRLELRRIDQTEQRVNEVLPLLPFANAIFELADNRVRVEPPDPSKIAATLFRIEKEIAGARKEIPSRKGTTNPAVANRAGRLTRTLIGVLKEWNTFYSGYDPNFTWWTSEPYGKLNKAMESYSDDLREKLAGVAKDDKDTIVGDPIGDAALRDELRFEIVPYSPEDLVKIAEKEFAWCDAEMLKASRALGYGDDWKKALEHVKNLYVPPGQQTTLVRDQVFEAIDFIEKRNLVTVPQYTKDIWRMRMMTPEEQRVNPFFLGGEQIIVSFPTAAMPHEAKLMSLRGNNIHFSRATVHHEVVPGHHLQLYMTQRYRPWRRAFTTPFWIEGWALYWEMRLWDLQFPQTPENRIGMLFWRMHRCARILFSLNFHLGKWSPQQCVDFLVDRVGHERENAAAEVRRSFEANYSPLYQAAYMLGGLQFRALHTELVVSGKMTEKAFHDAILQLGSMPVELVRASLLKQPLQPGFTSTWKFYGTL
ncbi:MAG: DUF885 family protein [Acidobacteria bacterium]|nr:DUF885 family protein [Acidobacteriota bacterium]